VPGVKAHAANRIFLAAWRPLSVEQFVVTSAGYSGCEGARRRGDRSAILQAGIQAIQGDFRSLAGVLLLM